MTKDASRDREQQHITWPRLGEKWRYLRLLSKMTRAHVVNRIRGPVDNIIALILMAVLAWYFAEGVGPEWRALQETAKVSVVLLLWVIPWSVWAAATQIDLELRQQLHVEDNAPDPPGAGLNFIRRRLNEYARQFQISHLTAGRSQHAVELMEPLRRFIEDALHESYFDEIVGKNGDPRDAKQANNWNERTRNLSDRLTDSSVNGGFRIAHYRTDGVDKPLEFIRTTGRCATR